MNIPKIMALITTILLILPLFEAATLKGTIYDSNLELENNVFVQINSTPAQQYLAKEGTYLFELLPGTYLLTANTETTRIRETIEIKEEGSFIYDLFMLPSLEEEEQLWQDTQENPLASIEEPNYGIWPYLVAGILFAIALIRIIYYRRKYGSVSFFRKKIKAESVKSLDEVKAELAQEPAYFDQALDIIHKHEGRISQKELRREMNYLSEAKVSLIVAELEHRGKIEKIKKGRGNLIFIRNNEIKTETR